MERATVREVTRPEVIQAFKAIIAHGITMNSVEQTSFYAVLCGEGGVSTEGDNECAWQKNGPRTIFLKKEPSFFLFRGNSTQTEVFFCESDSKHCMSD